MRVEIQSRVGNVIVGVLGVMYAVAGLVLFGIHFMQTWGAASLTDRAIQVLLIGVVAVSAWFVAIALSGLRLRVPHRRAAAAAAT
jgi:hypothetical protein